MVRRSNTQPSPAIRRGVYRHDWTRGGHFVFYAVDSRGEYVGELEADGLRVTETEAHDFLAHMLDLCDPVAAPQPLRLLKPPADASDPPRA
jgi:hypothetical protein